MVASVAVSMHAFVHTGRHAGVDVLVTRACSCVRGRAGFGKDEHVASRGVLDAVGLVLDALVLACYLYSNISRCTGAVPSLCQRACASSRAGSRAGSRRSCGVTVPR